MRIPKRLLVPGLVVVTLGACNAASPTATDAEPGDDPVLPQNFAQAWIGTWVGVGAGSIEDSSVTVGHARLVIAADADSIRSDRCPGCVTVTLDTVFAAVNVSPGDPIRFSLTITRGGYRRTLTLDRFSGGGRTANVLQGRLLLEALDGRGGTGDIAYLLELRRNLICRLTERARPGLTPGHGGDGRSWPSVSSGWLPWWPSANGLPPFCRRCW